MIWNWVLLLAGFALLIKGADWLVDGSSSIAKRLKISNIVIGLTLVAFGTSMPELVVNLFAGTGGSTDIALGNVIGSNMANTLLVLGVASIIYPLTVHKGTTLREIPFNLLAMIAVAVLANDIIFDGDTASFLTRGDGIALLLFFIIFIYYTFASGRVADSDIEQKAYDYFSLGRSFGAIALGVVALYFGGRWVVDSAISIASDFGISEGLVALTVVAIGTSLPELVTSAIAAKKKNVGIAIGNVVGSNIFNLLWILGLSAVIKPIPLSSGLNEDIFALTGVTILLFVSMFWGKRYTIQRWQGWLYLTLYLAYIVYIVYRG